MSRQEQNDRHIIWSDLNLDLDDWRESLEELYPDYPEDELYICEFAELCERNGHTVEPVAKENTKPAKEKEKLR